MPDLDLIKQAEQVTRDKCRRFCAAVQAIRAGLKGGRDHTKMIAQR
jgi:hypothetical protein